MKRVGIWKKTEEEERGAYALLENLIVMPVVFLILFALLFAGCMLHAQCTIESAARRGVLYAAKLIADPQYQKITAGAVDKSKGDLNELSSEDFDFTRIEHYEPYRYLPFLSSSFSFHGTTSIETNAQEYVRSILDQNITWMFTIDPDQIVCNADNYVISQEVSVKIKASYHMPRIFHYLGLPDTYDLYAGAVVSVSDPDEFIRNVDFASDLIRDIADTLGITEAISKPVSKLMNFAKKVFGS